MFAALCRDDGIVFIGSGKISFGKLSQALDYGALTLQIQGDFDAACARPADRGRRAGDGHLSDEQRQPVPLEGQKSIMYRILEARDWSRRTGSSCRRKPREARAFGKAFEEMKELGPGQEGPRLAVINASGANTLNVLVNERGMKWNGGKYDQSTIGEPLRRARRVELSPAHRRQRDRDQPPGESAQGACVRSTS
jgi:threonine synthase